MCSFSLSFEFLSFSLSTFAFWRPESFPNWSPAKNKAALPDMKLEKIELYQIQLIVLDLSFLILK